jgi:hypothetical protein
MAVHQTTFTSTAHRHQWPAPTVDQVHLKETGRLSGRHRRQASSHRGMGALIVPTLRVVMHPVTLCVTFKSGTRSVPGGIPTQSVGTIINRGTPPAFHHSTGRALARLQLLIYPPLRQAEWRRSSGGGRVAPCGGAAHIERRSSRSRPEAMPPDECRNEGTPSLSEGPDVGASLFFAYFF